jgi:sugar lactone lactonase YvrE
VRSRLRGQFALALDPGGTLFVADPRNDMVFRVDTITGDRTVVSSSAVGSGPSLIEPAGIVLEPGGDILVLDFGLQALLRVDPATGDREVVSSGGVGSGPAFVGVQGIALDLDGSALVSDLLSDPLFRVDTTSGDRSIVSSNSLIGLPSPPGLMGKPASLSEIPRRAPRAMRSTESLVPTSSPRSPSRAAMPSERFPLAESATSCRSCSRR